jgi:hypothetical protein
LTQFFQQCSQDFPTCPEPYAQVVERQRSHLFRFKGALRAKSSGSSRPEAKCEAELIAARIATGDPDVLQHVPLIDQGAGTDNPRVSAPVITAAPFGAEDPSFLLGLADEHHSLLGAKLREMVFGHLVFALILVKVRMGRLCLRA